MSNNIEEAQFEEVVPEAIPQAPTPEQGFVYHDIGMTESDETEEESSDTLDEDIAEFNKTSEQYRQSKIEEAKMFYNPETGEMVEQHLLPPFEQIKITARSIGMALNEPKKNCKHCHGRGYTGLKLDKTPVACECIFSEFFKSNPEAAKEQQNKNFPAMNRRNRRMYQKNVDRYFTDMLTKEKAHQEIVAKSKANLGKITPVKPKIVPETVTENVTEETTEEV